MDNGDLVADFADADFVTIRPFPHPTQMAGVRVSYGIDSSGFVH